MSKSQNGSCCGEIKMPERLYYFSEGSEGEPRLLLFLLLKFALIPWLLVRFHFQNQQQPVQSPSYHIPPTLLLPFSTVLRTLVIQWPAWIIQSSLLVFLFLSFKMLCIYLFLERGDEERERHIDCCLS